MNSSNKKSIFSLHYLLVFSIVSLVFSCQKERIISGDSQKIIFTPNNTNLVLKHPELMDETTKELYSTAIYSNEIKLQDAQTKFITTYRIHTTNKSFLEDFNSDFLQISHESNTTLFSPSPNLLAKEKVTKYPNPETIIITPIHVKTAKGKEVWPTTSRLTFSPEIREKFKSKNIQLIIDFSVINNNQSTDNNISVKFITDRENSYRVQFNVPTLSKSGSFSDCVVIKSDDCDDKSIFIISASTTFGATIEYSSFCNQACSTTGCSRTPTKKFNAATLNNLAFFNAKEMQYSGKELVFLYMNNRQEINRLLTSDNIKYQNFQNTFENFSKLTEPAIHASFGGNSSFTITNEHVQIGKQLLEELEKVTTSKELLKMIPSVKENLKVMKNKELKIGLKAFDRLPIESSN